MSFDSSSKKSEILQLRSVQRHQEDGGCCVYFLCDGDEVVRVGETTRAAGARLAEYRRDQPKTGWVFDDMLVQPCKRHERILLERQWIEILRPRYNSAYGYAGWPAPSPRFGALDIRRSRATEPSMSTDLVDPLASVRAYLAAEKAENTRSAYRSDWADFLEWCEKVSEAPLPAEPTVVARYLAWLADAGLNASTIARRCAAIRYAHKAANFEPPTNAEGVKAVMRGIRRIIGKKPVRKKPATAVLLAQVIAALPDTLLGKRDRALLLMGFATARRRSELVAFCVSDVEFMAKGMLVHVGRSKTDQEAHGQTIPVPRGKILKPVEALEAWLAAAKITEGPIFRAIDRHGNIASVALNPRSVAEVVKRSFAPLGVDIKDFSGHSLRAGFVTSSLDDHVDPFKIMKITGHKKVDTLQIYDRRESSFDDSAGDGFL